VTASITQDQANIVFDTILRLARRSEWISPLIVSVKRTPYPVLTLSNGATVEARSTQNRGEYLLGNDFDFVVFDEVAFESDPDYVVEEVILMRLADRAGMLDLVSTPNGKNWLYRRACDIIEKRRPGYFQSGDSRENTHISKKYLAERVTYFSESRLQQNIMGQFVDSGGEILKGEYIDRALAAPTLDEPGLYISGWDLARKRTATVGITIKAVGNRVAIVSLERFRFFDWNVVLEHIRERQRRYPGRLVVDATGLGDVVVEQLADYRPIPVIFTPTSKGEMLTGVELIHARGNISYDRWELPDGPGKTWSLEDELREARWDDNNKCDALMALALAIRPLSRPRPPMTPPRMATW
jgi:hypothetical protein